LGTVSISLFSSPSPISLIILTFCNVPGCTLFFVLLLTQNRVLYTKQTHKTLWFNWISYWTKWTLYNDEKVAQHSFMSCVHPGTLIWSSFVFFFPNIINVLATRERYISLTKVWGCLLSEAAAHIDLYDRVLLHLISRDDAHVRSWSNRLSTGVVVLYPGAVKAETILYFGLIPQLKTKQFISLLKIYIILCFYIYITEFNFWCLC
jgi:hypothetical protein